MRASDWQRAVGRRLSRRDLLRSAAVGSGLLSAYLIACGGSKKKAGSPTTTGATSTSTPSTNATLTPSTLAWRKIDARGSGPNDSEFPPPRHDHSLVTDGQKLYVFGGRGPNALGDLWAFDIATSQWNNKLQANEGPPARFGHNAIWDPARARMVVFGGQNGSDFYNDMWEFDPALGQWTQVAISGPAPKPRYGAGGAFDQDSHLLITHGFTSAGRFDDTWQFGLGGSGWTDISPQGTRPIKRCLMRAVWDSHKLRLLIFGGQTDGTPFLDDLWSWSTERGWATLARDPHPSARTFYSMIYDNINDQAVLFGGNTEHGPLNDLWAFRSSGENWTQIPATGTPPDPRYGHDAAFASDKAAMYVFGGVNGPTLFNDVWEISV